MKILNYLATQSFAADITGVWINKGEARNLAFAVTASGADLAASLVVQGAIDQTLPVLVSTTALATAGDLAIEVESSLPYIRLFLDYTSGTGNVTVSACVPALADSNYG